MAFSSKDPFAKLYQLQGEAWPTALSALQSGDWAAETKGALHPERISSTSLLSRDGFAPQVLQVRLSCSVGLILQAALYFVSLGGSFQEILERSLRFAGAANYCPVCCCTPRLFDG